MNYWNNEGIPHKGWVFVDMEDLGEFVEPGEIAYESCRMCGKEKIRFVHILEHQEYGLIRVGRSCASKMEQDYERPEQRDADCRKKAARRINFLKQDWRQNAKGNYVLKYKGDQITIFRNQFGQGWAVAFKDRVVKEYKGRNLADINTAKLAAFDLFDSLHEVQHEDDYPWELERWL